jgi:hypothetical protein
VAGGTNGTEWQLKVAQADEMVAYVRNQKTEQAQSWLGSCKTVLDPFMGSGTTLVAAKGLEMAAVGIESNQDYCDMAIERLER